MTTSLKDRFRQVDEIPTPWDDRAAGVPTAEPRRARWTPRAVAIAGLAAVIAAVVVVVDPMGSDDPRAQAADASWLVEAQQSCVEPYSVQTLANRSYAFEGVISGVVGPANPEGPEPADMTTTVTFDVDRWFWGGSGAQAVRQTYAFASSAGTIDRSVGARLLVSGDDVFIWACGFTQPATPDARADYEAASAERSP